jgi:hypothetical protein
MVLTYATVAMMATILAVAVHNKTRADPLL